MRLSSSPVGSDANIRKMMSELSYIVGHLAGIAGICLVWGKVPIYLVTRSVRSKYRGGKED